jgi:hypothetical protein
MLAFLIASVMYAQAVYWLLIRDDERDRVVWEACVNPGLVTVPIGTTKEEE